MPDPFTAFQTASAALGCAQVAKEILDLVRKFSRAKETSLEALRRVELVEHHFHEVYTIFESYNPDNPPPSELRRLDSTIVATAEACKRILIDIKARLRSITDDKSALQNAASRLDVALRDNSLSRLQDNLDAHLVSARNDARGIRRDILELRKQLESTSLLRSNWTTSNPRFEGSLPSPDSNRRRRSSANAAAGFHRYRDEAKDVMKKFLDDATSVFEEQRSQHADDVESLEDQYPYGPAGRVNVDDEQHQPGGPCARSGRLSANAESTEDSVVNGVMTLGLPRSSRPLHVLDNHVASYTQAFHLDVAGANWEQAEKHLRRAMDYSRDRQEQHQVDFTNEPELAEHLVDVLQRQGKWRQAIEECQNLLRPYAAIGGSHIPSHQHQSPKAARYRQLLAATFYERYKRDTQSKTDLEMAEEHAEQAVYTRDNQMNEGGDDPDETKRHLLCLELLIRVLQAQDKTIEAKTFREMMWQVARKKNVALDSVWPGHDPEGMGSLSPSKVSVSTSNSDDREHAKLIDAILSPDPEAAVEEMLQAKDRIDLEHCVKLGRTPLMHAVARRNMSVVGTLLNPPWSAMPNTRNSDGDAAIHIAADEGMPTIADSLIRHGADPELKDAKQNTALMRAMTAEHGEFVNWLLTRADRCAKVDTVTEDGGRLLHWAVKCATPKMLSLLMQSVLALPDGGDELSNIRDDRGKTALHHCAELRKLRHAKVLVEPRNSPVDVNLVDGSERTALFYLVSQPYSPQRNEMAMYLVEHGADLAPGRMTRNVDQYPEVRKAMAQRRASTHDYDMLNLSNSPTANSASTTSNRNTRGTWFSRRRS